MGQHWYDGETGAPRYTVIGANGKEKPTTIREARKLNLVPSFTTVMSMLDKPGLNIWKVEQVISAAKEWPFREGADEAEWRSQVRQISETVGREGRDRGHKVHDALEIFYKEGKMARGQTKLLRPVVDLIKGTYGEPSWVAEESFAFEGYGGKCDLHSKDGEGIVIDFKTKDIPEDKKMVAYLDNCMQLAAYRDGLGIPKARCVNVFINVRVPGMLMLHEWKEEELKKAKKMFSLLCEYWRLANNL